MLEIKIVNIEDIKEYPNNAKLHPDYQIEAIKKSITEFGFNDPIALDKNNTIIEGHGRYLAAKSLNLKEIPVIYLNNLSDEQIKAYIIVHNKLTLMTDFDISILEKELNDIENIDMDEYGLNLLDDMFDEFKELSSVNTPKTKKSPTKHKCPKCGCEF